MFYSPNYVWQAVEKVQIVRYATIRMEVGTQVQASNLAGCSVKLPLALCYCKVTPLAGIDGCQDGEPRVSSYITGVVPVPCPELNPRSPRWCRSHHGLQHCCHHQRPRIAFQLASHPTLCVPFLPLTLKGQPSECPSSGIYPAQPIL